jgi:hypothetical protein
MSRFAFLFVIVLQFVPCPHCVHGQEVSGEPAERAALIQRFEQHTQPFLKTYCLPCHNPERAEGKLDLSEATSVDQIVEHDAIWQIVLQRVQSGEMPPDDAEHPPSEAARGQFVEWLNQFRRHEADRNAGDPGSVLARRLSNAEFDNSIRDLTGHDLRPTKEFPVDPANEEGFDNSGESLRMSPALMQKYLSAARFVADHAVLTPKEILFAPHLVVTETDRDLYCVQRIVDFYQRHRVDYSQYLMTLWKFQHRDTLAKPETELDDFATQSGLSAKYLRLLQQMFAQPEPIGPIRELQAKWAELPADPSELSDAEQQCQAIEKLIVDIRQDLDDPVEQLRIPGVSAGSQPLVLWWNREKARRRRIFPGDGEDAELDAARHRFCQIFPNEFAVVSRGHYSNEELGANVRLLSAGFHLMQGFFRDDQPLCDLVLTDAEIQELDQLWEDLNFVTLAPFRQYRDFLFFERAEPPRFAMGPEFDFARPEDKDCTSAEKVERLRALYVQTIREREASDPAVEAVDSYFREMNALFRHIEQQQTVAETLHQQSLLQFAKLAWRRPLTDSEKKELLEFYQELRTTESLGHEDAIRDSLAMILMSPHFCYRFGTNLDASAAEALSSGVVPLTDYELASRLSYFLWASMPDQTLLEHAAQGDLRQPEVLTAEIRRMVKDQKVRGLATEFLGNWLEFRRFEEHNAVDRNRYPSFDDQLRKSMFEEPIRFFVDLAERDGSLTEVLFADHTFVNRPLAIHYGVTSQELPSEERADQWIRLDQASAVGRGGLLPMAVFLTRNSPGLRTSPVKRGYWVVRRVLGEHIPAPPPNVPELPKDEAEFGDLSLSELLAKHRDHSACSGCHQRFDSMGLVFEGYGPIGERREVDLGGRPVQAVAEFPDGSNGEGFEDLRSYLASERKDDFVETFVRRMFAFALGRSLKLSDTLAVEDAKRRLAANDYRLSVLLESIVTSRQFLNRVVNQ